ncbi:hypothetical protein ZIOFF_002756 [Zingiber officinale]|uniref:Protein kinase domain-containing protein n=1 Tax=Zingiber officinale TaxID=94328 RepID=A0A8J5LZC6_ZINOF|nr:hypothetical protein ZIOFF_002756 [Zingiber officinale]
MSRTAQPTATDNILIAASRGRSNETLRLIGPKMPMGTLRGRVHYLPMPRADLFIRLSLLVPLISCLFSAAFCSEVLLRARKRLKKEPPWMDKWMLCGISVLLSSLDDLERVGRALLAFRRRIEADPYGALSNWDEGACDPCLWFGVECSDDGEVEVLKLRDLNLKGTLAPEIGMLSHIRTIILHNNSFSGVIPGEFGRLENLELLDLGHNNLSGPLPSEFGKMSSLKLLIQIDEMLVSSNRQRVTRKIENTTMRRLLFFRFVSSFSSQNAASQSQNPPASPNSDSPAQSPSSPSPSPSQSVSPSAIPLLIDPPNNSPLPALATEGPTNHRNLVVPLVIGGLLLSIISIATTYFLCYRAQKAASVMPWATGLSVPLLRRSELETACEHFSNIIGSLSNCTLCKGTLSSGTEIAVTSTVLTSAENWSDQNEIHFRNKISTLSKVNHKNFMNLIGYCKEEELFTRMMVFEYASNGTLFEHLHIKEVEQLEWSARLRVIMGIAYCLQHMEQLNPPLVIRSLSSSSIYLTEDCAAKISDLEFWDDEKTVEPTSESSKQEKITYKFGIILLEIISGRLPFSEDDGLLVLWASSYLNGKRPLMDMVDNTLTPIHDKDITELADVIRSCINASPENRLTMTEVAERLRIITSITPEEAYPKLSPLWWAELEIISQ